MVRGPGTWGGGGIRSTIVNNQLIYICILICIVIFSLLVSRIV